MRKDKDWIKLFEEEKLIRSDVLLRGQKEFDFTSVDIPKKEEMKAIIEYLEVEPKNLYYFYCDYLPCFYYINEKGFNYIKLITTRLKEMKLIKAKRVIDSIVTKQANSLKDGDYSGIFDFIEREYRIEAFIQLLDLYEHSKVEIGSGELFDVFTDAYMSSESGFNEFSREDMSLIMSLNTDNSYKNNINADDNGYVTIYRGEGELSTPLDKAYSWTLDKEKAEWFANRFDPEGIGIIYQAKVNIGNINAYFKSRDEEEVIIFPEDVVDVQII